MTNRLWSDLRFRILGSHENFGNWNQRQVPNYPPKIKYLGKDFLEKMGLIPFLMSFCSARKVFRRLAKLHEKMGPNPVSNCLFKVNNGNTRTISNQS